MKSSEFEMFLLSRIASLREITSGQVIAIDVIPNVEAIMFGDGPDRNNVERILASEGSGVSVSLAGNIPNSEVQQRLQQFDVITLLSDYEGRPIALLEGVVCGFVPVCLKHEKKWYLGAGSVFAKNSHVGWESSSSLVLTY